MSWQFPKRETVVRPWWWCGARCLHFILGISCLRLLGAVSLSADEPLESDWIILADGRKLEGAVLNPTFRFRTSYATFELKKEQLRELNLNELKGSMHSALTVYGDRFTGLLEDPTLKLISAAGEHSDFRREKIARVDFCLPENEKPAANNRRRCLRMRNGDRLMGDFGSDQLALVNEDSQVQVSVAELHTLLFSSTNSAVAAVFLHSGRTLHGRIESEELVFDLALGFRLTLHQASMLQVTDFPANTSTAGPVNTNRPGMVWIPGGSFVMGSPAEEPGRDPDEGPPTRVVIPNSYWIGKCEVSQAEFQSVMDSNPSHAAGQPLRPVERVTWFEATEYCQELTALEQSQGRLPEGYTYRLPTEAEWEYACRAGTTTRFSYGDDNNETQLEEYAWFARNSESMTRNLGTRRPNPWGLHDMHGNVWEWCLDRFEGKYPGGTITNSPGTAQGNLRVARGGSWLYEARGCRSANRDDYGPGNRCSDVGFRVVLAPLASR